jgi:hypothetical protein
LILTGVLLLLTLIGTVATALKLPRTYQSQSSVVLLASRATSKPNGNNPYLSFSPSLTLTADVVSRKLMAPGTVNYLASRGFPDPYTVALAPYTTQTTGSVLLVTVTGTGEARVERTLHGVTSEISASLARLQAGTTANDRIRAATISMSQQAALSVSHTVRSLAVLIGLGLGLSFGIPRIMEAPITERLIRRKLEPAARAPYPADPVADDRWAAPQHATQRDSSLASTGRSSTGSCERDAAQKRQSPD